MGRTGWCQSRFTSSWKPSHIVHCCAFLEQKRKNVLMLSNITTLNLTMLGRRVNFKEKQ